MDKNYIFDIYELSHNALLNNIWIHNHIQPSKLKEILLVLLHRNTLWFKHSSYRPSHIITKKTADCEWMPQIWLIIRYTQIDLFPELTLGHAIKVFISDSLQIIRFTICTATAFQAINISFVNNSFKFWFISWIYFDPTWVYNLD